MPQDSHALDWYRFLTMHAIDRASTRLRKLWLREASSGEGIATWLYLRSTEAWSHGVHRARNGATHVTWRGVVFVFNSKAGEPARLVTVRAAK